MPNDAIPTAAVDFAFEAEGLYRALLRAQSIESNVEPTLGGNLLYIGELSSRGRALTIAGNIAGAASLAGTADPAAQKQAVRDGVADFLVTSLDEALRILKNEIRKRETVAVCLAAAPQDIEREMLERGVLPNLLPPHAWVSTDFGQRARRIAMERESRIDLAWSVAKAPTRWLPRLNALALECFGRCSDFDGLALRRWIRLAPRYLGRLAQDFRVLRSRPVPIEEFIAQARRAVESCEIESSVRICVNRDERVLTFEPPGHEQKQP